MNSIDRLIRDTDYIVELLNGPCRPGSEESTSTPVNREWIDEEASGTVTAAINRLLPDGIPYLNYVIAERNPDTGHNGTSVDDNEKRLRYFVVTVIPDTEFPYDRNYALFNMLRIAGLHCWELTRAILAASREYMGVGITVDPKPPMLNNARIEWVSLYLGRKPYDGHTRLSEQWLRAEEFDGFELDVHLFKLRELPEDPLVRRMIDAYDADHPETTEENETTDDSDET